MWEERINHRQMVGQIQAQIHANHGHPCPNCGQMNAKVRQVLNFFSLKPLFRTSSYFEVEMLMQNEIMSVWLIAPLLLIVLPITIDDFS